MTEVLRHLKNKKEQTLVIAPESDAPNNPYFQDNNFQEALKWLLFLELCEAAERGVKYVVSEGIDPFSVIAAKEVLSFNEADDMENIILYMIMDEYFMNGAELAAKLYSSSHRQFRLDYITYFADEWRENLPTEYDNYLISVGSTLLCCCPKEAEDSRHLIKAARKNGIKIINLYEKAKLEIIKYISI